MELSRKTETLRSTLGFEGLKPAELKGLAEMAFTRRYARGEFIFHEGDPPRFFKVVVKGLVKLMKSTPEGKSFTAVMGCPGDTLNAVVLFEGLPRFLTAQAIRDVEVLCIQRDDFVSFVRGNSDVALRIISVLGRLVQTSYDRNLDLVGERVDQRIINMLFMLNRKLGDTLNFTNNELAELAGASTETTIRVMSQLRKLGIVESSRARMVVVDPDRLKEMGRGPFWA